MRKLFKYLFLFIIFICNLYGNVVLISPDNFIKGESLIFEIEARGSSIDFPKIEKIDDYIVKNLGSSRTITNVNGQINSVLKNSYLLFPTKDLEIPSFEVKIDNQIYKTKSKIVKEISPSQTLSKNFELKISTDKNSLYVGEETILKIRFKYKKDLQIVDLSFSMPKLENIWMKQLDNQKNIEEGEYNIQEIDFLIFPQKSGTIEISPARIDVKIVDMSQSSFSMFTTPTKSLKIYSNSLSLQSKPLPENINLIGEFLITSDISKSEIDAGEALSYKIKIEGNGNIDDIKDIKLDIKDTTIYENKPNIQTKVLDNKYIGTYEKSFSILANKDFTIPSYELKYFDKNIKKVVIQKTPAYTIKVNNQIAVSNNLEKIEKVEPIIKEKIVYKNSIKDRVLFFIFGLLFALLTFGLYKYVKNLNKKDKDDLPLVKLIKNCKTKEELIKKIVPYLSANSELDAIIFKLEKDNNIDLKKEKKEIIQIVKSLKI